MTTCDAKGNHCKDTITVTAQPPDPIQLLTAELANSYNENGDDDPRSTQPHPVITLPLSLTQPSYNTCVAGYGAAGAALGSRAGWVGGGAAALLFSETGPGDILIAYGAKVGTSAVGVYAGQKAGQLLGNIFCASSTEGSGQGSEPRPSVGAQDKKLNQSEIRELEETTGESAHQIKSEALGTNKSIAQYDLYKDLHGNVFVKAKGGIGEAIPTGLKINR